MTMDSLSLMMQREEWVLHVGEDRREMPRGMVKRLDSGQQKPRGRRPTQLVCDAQQTKTPKIQNPDARQTNVGGPDRLEKEKIQSNSNLYVGISKW